MGGQHAVLLVVEQLVEALPADPGLVEDVGDGGRLVALGGGHPHDGRQQALALGAGDQLAREAVATARQPPLAQVVARCPSLGRRSGSSAVAGAAVPASAPRRGRRTGAARGRRSPAAARAGCSAAPAAIWLKISTWARPKARPGSVCGPAARRRASQRLSSGRDQQRAVAVDRPPVRPRPRRRSAAAPGPAWRPSARASRRPLCAPPRRASRSPSARCGGRRRSSSMQESSGGVEAVALAGEPFVEGGPGDAGAADDVGDRRRRRRSSRRSCRPSRR